VDVKCDIGVGAPRVGLGHELTIMLCQRAAGV